MAYSACSVAKYFIEQKLQENNTPPTPMQLLKLVYIAHGWNLAINDKPLISDRIEAWKYGPVIPNLYHEIKHWGNEPVKMIFSNPVSDTHSFLREDRNVMDAVLESYDGIDGIRLSVLTHAAGTPWHEVYFDKDGNSRSNAEITDEIIRRHFVKLGKSVDDDTESQ